MSYRTYHLLVFFVLVAVLFQTPSVNGQDPCNKINSCSCKNSKGTIDLSPLDSGGGNNPKFKDIPAADQNAFSWNPCTPFSEGQGTCTSVAACQIQTGFFSNFIDIGHQESATFVTGSGSQLSLQYSATVRGVTRTTHVALVCDAERDPGDLEALGEDPRIVANYFLTYTGIYACPVPDPQSGLSAGSILLIIFFFLLFLYLVCGLIYQKFVRRATGNEVIPHFTFWVTLPRLVQDGTYFVISRGKVNKGYENV